MLESWSYAVLGRGRWARRIKDILEAENRRVACIEQTRCEAAELTGAIRASGAQAAWLCVTPGPHVAPMMMAAIEAGVHVVAEKPWLCSNAETQTLARAAQARGIKLGVHFEYCLLEQIERWRERYQDLRGLRFGGRFTVSRADRLGVPALENLGSHLAAIRRYAAPLSEITQLICAYDATDERRVWIEDDESIDFLENSEPLIQRFVRWFENSAAFPLGIEFALKVAEDLARWRDRQTAASLPP
jgi:hypothetical protein